MSGPSRGRWHRLGPFIDFHATFAAHGRTRPITCADLQRSAERSQMTGCTFRARLLATRWPAAVGFSTSPHCSWPRPRTLSSSTTLTSRRGRASTPRNRPPSCSGASGPVPSRSLSGPTSISPGRQHAHGVTPSAERIRQVRQRRISRSLARCEPSLGRQESRRHPAAPRELTVSSGSA